uniref:Uncharacterized protein n=1 Tax=viral metagenome TaxID=1070528 RepID=A0A6C0BML4_9ZZZZ
MTFFVYYCLILVGLLGLIITCHLLTPSLAMGSISEPFVDATVATMTVPKQTACKVIGSYQIEKCGDEIKVKGVDPDAPKNGCPFPLEKHDQGCQLKCPTTTFLSKNPNILCQRVISGEILPTTNEKCPDGYRMDPAGCVKILTTCPANYDWIDGTCREKCPEGTESKISEVEIDRDGFVEKQRTRVCQVKPLISVLK